MDNSINNNFKEKSLENFNENEMYQEPAESDEKNDSGNKFFRGLLTAAVSVSFAVFVYLLIYFCENTGA